ncbi:MAG: hypothetical protein ACYC96_11355 [Fimbriimonadaceae bacterium]
MMDQLWRGSFVVIGMLPALALAAPRPAVNAFLDADVSSTAQLVHQVQSRADVRDRYMRHFGMTALEVYSYLGTLRLSRLPRAEVATVYSVPGSGEVRSHKQKLHKGDLVFVDPAGRGALLARCGNPLALGPNNVANMALEQPAIEGTEVLNMEAMPEVTGSPVMMIDPRPAIAMMAPPDTIADVMSDVPPVTTTVITAPTAPPIAAVAPAAPPSVGGGNSGNPLAILPILGGGALLGILSSHHGGGGPPFVPSPAPEPLPVIGLTIGALALISRRRR